MYPNSRQAIIFATVLILIGVFFLFDGVGGKGIIFWGLPLTLGIISLKEAYILYKKGK
jgi:hypothetical protein